MTKWVTRTGLIECSCASLTLVETNSAAKPLCRTVTKYNGGFYIDRFCKKGQQFNMLYKFLDTFVASMILIALSVT
ncbi:uncharacterized protein FIBRA_09358 [Fibroporia radiculosa]|uniref:Uncharacterized protein n=1 Tax=Fibroporia radiculosa TaxID=599839 RepID=J7S6D0_9APHY|nr:uncharacterized protein FIBRA_09358 [Fibroporia radiculosa]CCM07039.1 predicted protein [Fibroporia radiculosa]